MQRAAGSGAVPSTARQAGAGHQAALLLAVMVLLLGAIIGRLAWLQLLHGAENRAMADENRIRLLPRNPVRGRLLDRKGRVLATNRLTYNLYVQPLLIDDRGWPQLRDRLASLLGIPAARLEAERRRGVNAEGFRVPLATALTPVQVLRFREQAGSLQGAEVSEDVLRAYPGGSLGAHVMGYTSSITEEEYRALRDQRPRHLPGYPLPLSPNLRTGC